MKVIGFKTVAIKRLTLAGDIRARLEAPHVYERSQSIKRLGLLHPPVVRKSDMRVCSGNDRIAAMLLLGETEVLVQLVECTDKELAEVEAAENCQRRHSNEEARNWQRRLLALYEEMVSEQPQAITADQKYNAGKSSRGIKRQAVERLARETGVKPDTVKKRLQRGRKADKKRQDLHAQVTGEAPPAFEDLELLGMDVDEAFVRDMTQVVRHIGDLGVRLTAARNAMGILLKASLPLPTAKFVRMAEDLSALAAAMRGAKPVALCPYCKGLPTIQEQCVGCVRTGWVCADQAPGIPSQLWAKGPRAVVVQHGKERLVLDVIAELQEPETAAAALDEAVGELQA